MITIDAFYDVSKLFEAGQNFIAVFGGRFLGHSPDGRLFYTPKDGKGSRLSPPEETADSLSRTFQDSVESKRNLIMERWPVLEYKDGCDY